MRYVGHDAIVQALQESMAPVTLLTGPTGVGKWTLGSYLADWYQVHSVDRFFQREKLTADAVRQLLNFVSRSSFGNGKWVQLRLDGAQEGVLAILLKTLEEPPSSTRFVLTSAEPVLATIISRAHVYRMGVLTPEEIKEILAVEGRPRTAIEQAAQQSGGQLNKARQLVNRLHQDAIIRVERVLQAVASRDVKQYEQAFRGFDETTKNVLIQALKAAICGQPSLLAADENIRLQRNSEQAQAMLVALSGLPAASARLSVRIALEPFLHT